MVENRGRISVEAHEDTLVINGSIDDTARRAELLDRARPARTAGLRSLP